MDCYTKLDEDLYYIGYSDRRIDLFENVYPVPEGVSYNSYLLIDDKTALLDGVDRSVSDVFLSNIQTILAGKPLDYLIVNHVEPDHSASIKMVTTLHPETKIVCTMGAKNMLGQFFDEDVLSRVMEVEKMDSLNLGKHTLKFVKAPMVHWPEVMVTYDETTKTLFSADAFGAFGAIVGSPTLSDTTLDESAKDRYRRYYVNIVGKFGNFVDKALTALSTLEITRVCPLHGHVLEGSVLETVLNLYKLWSKYLPEEKGVLIVYSSVYGGTELVCNKLANALSDGGVKNIEMYDVSKTHSSYLLSLVAKYSHLVLASTTYNMGVFVNMENFVHDIANHEVSGRHIALIENGTWAPVAKDKIRAILESSCKNTVFIDKTVTIRSKAKTKDIADINELASQICKDIVD